MEVKLDHDEDVLTIKPLKQSLVNQTAGSLRKFVDPKFLNIPFEKVREETQKLATADLGKKYE